MTSRLMKAVLTSKMKEQKNKKITSEEYTLFTIIEKYGFTIINLK